MQEFYSPHHIEKYVQKHWDKHQTFSVTENQNKQKYYCLSMLPYPSGKLHMGHVRNYTIGDVISRYQRMLGKNVLQPMGWDAFGLPAEHAAITNNTNPLHWTYSNIAYMKKQLKSLGFAYDWKREIITCQPKYYKWEQWFFTILYNKGLIYKKKTIVNWCSYHKTVLANEQVINNLCWRCQNPIEYKNMSQWFIKITDYAEQLLDGLDQLKHWPNQVKTMQRNWIGKSTGIIVNFPIMNSNDILPIYITRIDIFMGITYLTISIDHPISLKKAIFNIEISNFIKNQKIFLMEHNNYFKNKTKKGIFTQIYAIHPLTHDKLPIWIANFIPSIKSNDIGAIASCPAHNQHDWEFAQKYNLSIKPVIKHINGQIPNIKYRAMTEHGILFNSQEFNELTSSMASNAITQVLINRKLAHTKTSYCLKDWSISRQRFWGTPIPMITLNNGIIKPLSINELPVILPIKEYSIDKDGDNSLKKYSNWIRTKYKDQIAFRDTDTFDTFIESSWYYARYTCPHYHEHMIDFNSANYWLPIDQYIGGIEHATMHLMYFRFYHKLMRDEGLLQSDEPAIRLLCQGMILSDSFYYLSNQGQKIWVSPDNVIITRNKLGHIKQAVDIDGNNLIYAGMYKMSKSKNNGIDPNIIIKKYGADSVRFFIMFAAPVNSTLIWQESGIEGAHRFLKKLWNMTYQHIKIGLPKKFPKFTLDNQHKFIRNLIHTTIIKVTNDIDKKQSFNTALSSIMKLFNQLKYISKINIQNQFVLQEALSVIVRLLYPFTPHISFILWKALGNPEDIDHAQWPSVDIKAIKNENKLIIIQVNGKKRKIIMVPSNSNKDVIYNIARKEIFSNKKLMHKKINKTIYVPDRIINFIIK